MAFINFIEWLPGPWYVWLLGGVVMFSVSFVLWNMDGAESCAQTMSELLDIDRRLEAVVSSLAELRPLIVEYRTWLYEHFGGEWNGTKTVFAANTSRGHVISIETIRDGLFDLVRQIDRAMADHSALLDEPMMVGKFKQAVRELRLVQLVGSLPKENVVNGSTHQALWWSDCLQVLAFYLALLGFVVGLLKYTLERSSFEYFR